jgi:hypothetical protein
MEIGSFVEINLYVNCFFQNGGKGLGSYSPPTHIDYFLFTYLVCVKQNLRALVTTPALEKFTKQQVA